MDGAAAEGVLAVAGLGCSWVGTEIGDSVFGVVPELDLAGDGLGRLGPAGATRVAQTLRKLGLICVESGSRTAAQTDPGRVGG